MLKKEEIDRFYEIVKGLGLKFPVAAISKATGYSKGNVSSYLSRKLDPSENFLEAFYKAFPDSFKKVPQETVSEGNYRDKLREIRNGKKDKKIPFYDAPVAGGITETEMTAIHAPAGTIDVGDLLNDSQAAIRVYGNSMIPNYPPGCVVGLAKCSSSFIEPGEVYVIETRDRRIVKRLFFKDDDPTAEDFLCYSDNVMKFEGGARDGKLAYPPFLLPKKEIINLFTVTGVIKRNANSVIINR